MHLNLKSLISLSIVILLRSINTAILVVKKSSISSSSRINYNLVIVWDWHWSCEAWISLSINLSLCLESNINILMVKFNIIMIDYLMILLLKSTIYRFFTSFFSNFLFLKSTKLILHVFSILNKLLLLLATFSFSFFWTHILKFLSKCIWATNLWSSLLSNCLSSLYSSWTSQMLEVWMNLKCLMKLIKFLLLSDMNWMSSSQILILSFNLC